MVERVGVENVKMRMAVVLTVENLNSNNHPG